MRVSDYFLIPMAGYGQNALNLESLIQEALKVNPEISALQKKRDAMSKRLASGKIMG